MKITTVVLLLFIFLSGCRDKETGIHPGRNTITEAVYGSATVIPKETYIVFSPINGLIEQSDLREGAAVEQGTELFRISDQRAKLERKKARQNYAHARESYRGDVAILREMAERLESATISMVNDSINYVRQSRLWQQNIGSQQAFETMELRFKTARNKVNELKKAYERTRQNLADQMALAETALEISDQFYGEHSIRAKMSGTVYEVMKQVGESVTTQTPVARIGSTDSFIIELLIDEVDIARVQVGQKAVLVLDAYRDQSFEAKITRIFPHKDDRSQTFTVEAVFTTPPVQLYDGLSGEANIIIAQRKKVLTLPTEYIGPDNNVLTADGKRAVVTGVSDLRYTEIISGIDTSTTIYPIE